VTGSVKALAADRLRAADAAVMRARRRRTFTAALRV